MNEVEYADQRENLNQQPQSSSILQESEIGGSNNTMISNNNGVVNDVDQNQTTSTREISTNSTSHDNNNPSNANSNANNVNNSSGNISIGASTFITQTVKSKRENVYGYCVNCNCVTLNAKDGKCYSCLVDLVDTIKCDVLTNVMKCQSCGTCWPTQLMTVSVKCGECGAQAHSTLTESIVDMLDFLKDFASFTGTKDSQWQNLKKSELEAKIQKHNSKALTILKNNPKPIQPVNKSQGFDRTPSIKKKFNQKERRKPPPSNLMSNNSNFSSSNNNSYSNIGNNSIMEDDMISNINNSINSMNNNSSGKPLSSLLAEMQQQFNNKYFEFNDIIAQLIKAAESFEKTVSSSNSMQTENDLQVTGKKRGRSSMSSSVQPAPSSHSSSSAPSSSTRKHSSNRMNPYVPSERDALPLNSNNNNNDIFYRDRTLNNEGRQGIVPPSDSQRYSERSGALDRSDRQDRNERQDRQDRYSDRQERYPQSQSSNNNNSYSNFESDYNEDYFSKKRKFE